MGGHMREALLQSSVSRKHPHQYKNSLLNIDFRRNKLLEATSMVHSPILDVSQPDTLNYPHSENINYMDCKVNENEAIYVPSFFWHEVTSIPGKKVRNYHFNNYLHLNTALNFWFVPVFKKEFPCKYCRKKFNYKRYF